MTGRLDRDQLAMDGYLVLKVHIRVLNSKITM
jgi:hypothetical protein